MQSKEYEYIEIPKERYNLLNEAVKEMNAAYSTADDFINTRIKETLEQYQEWKRRRRQK